MVHQFTCNNIAPDCTNHYVIKHCDLSSHYDMFFHWVCDKTLFLPITTNV